MRVDGQDPAQVNPNSPPALGRVVNNSGNLRFAEGADDGNVKFTHKLTDQQAGELLPGQQSYRFDHGPLQWRICADGQTRGDS